MVYFRLGRPLQVVLVGAALAAAPSCGSPSDGPADADADAPGDADAEAEADADAGVDADADVGDVDAPVEAEAEGGADADVEDDGTVEVDTWEVVDPPPPPMCADVPGYSLSTATISGDTEKAVAQVTLSGTVRPFGDPCFGPCASR